MQTNWKLHLPLSGENPSDTDSLSPQWQIFPAKSQSFLPGRCGAVPLVGKLVGDLASFQAASQCGPGQKEKDTCIYLHVLTSPFWVLKFSLELVLSERQLSWKCTELTSSPFAVVLPLIQGNKPLKSETSSQDWRCSNALALKAVAQHKYPHLRQSFLLFLPSSLFWVSVS